jgi:hypothetical protein
MTLWYHNSVKFSHQIKYYNTKILCQNIGLHGPSCYRFDKNTTASKQHKEGKRLQNKAWNVIIRFEQDSNVNIKPGQAYRHSSIFKILLR